jgi:hypothetical protein
MPERRDLDILTVPIWIDTTGVSAKRLFVRVYVTDERGFILITAQSPTFATPV